MTSAMPTAYEALPVSIRQILCPTDMSSHSEHALEHALLLARRFGARLTLYHAVEMIDQGYTHWRFGHSSEMWCEAEAAARLMLAERAGRLDTAHDDAVVERVGSVAQAILAQIKARQPDLIVMATHGRTGLAHLLLGSVLEKVVQHTFRPILTVPDRGSESPAPAGEAVRPYSRIVLPTDYSLASRLAFPLAASLARAFGAEVIALHVVTESRTLPVFTESGLLRFVQPEFAEVRVTPRIIDGGSVWDRIVQTAGTEHADLIMMSTRGHHSLADNLLGSNTERVVRHAPCPVLVA